MKKKVLSLILAGVMAVGLLSGCGNSSKTEDNGSTGSEAKDSDTQAEETEDSGEMYDVVMQLPVIGDAPVGLEDVEAAINEITKEIGVTLTLEPVNAFNLATETSLAISSGEKLDLCLSLFSGVSSLVNTGSIIDLSELLENEGKDVASVCGIQMAGGMYDGKYYGIPSAYINGNNLAFVCRKDILDKYGITIEKDKVYTVEEFEDIFATIKSGEGDSFYIMAGGYDGDLPLKGLVPYDDLLAGCGLMFTDGYDSEEIVNYYASDEYKEYADRMYDWAQKGYFSPDASTTTEVAATQIGSGKYLGTFANDSGLTAADYGQMTGTEMVCITMREAFSTTKEFQSVLWSIPTTCENPQKTMAFMSLLYTNEDLANLLLYGLEGVSYEVVEEDADGKVIQPLDGKNIDEVPYWCQFGVFGNRLKVAVTAPNTTKTNEKLQEFSDNIKYQSPALGFVCNFDNVSTEYSAVNAVIEQHRSILNTGAVNPAEQLPIFLNSLNDAGIDKIVEDVRAQFNEWKSEQ